MRNSTAIKKCMLALGLILAGLMPLGAWAHGGASVDTDQCRVIIDGHIVHFTAYQPQLAGSTEYCTDIPQTGVTSVVFDYEGKQLRDMTVEFEITKEPEGTRIFYQEPTKLKRGTFNTNVNFADAGKYRVHVTLVNDGKKVDEHIGLKVGAGAAGSNTTTLLVIAVLLIAGLYIFYLSNAAFKAAVDKVLKKEA